MSESPAVPQSAKFSALAIVAFVFAFLFSLIGLILGIIAYVRTGSTGMRGRGLALAAIILSAVFLILQIILASTGHLYFYTHTTS